MDEKISILCVDDEKTNLFLFKINFQKKYNIITGMSGHEGLELLRNNPEIKVVISDMKMPGMNGLEFILKAKVEFPNVKFYILTGFEITPPIEEAIKSKLILGYFSKPFSVNEIDSAISQALN